MNSKLRTAIVTLCVFLSLHLQNVFSDGVNVNPSSYLAPQVKVPNYHVNDIWKAHTHLPNYPEIEAAARDTFVALPSSYDTKYRNPCWTQDGTFKCLPYFQILGVSKCGTTDLYNRLTEHPDMIDCSWKRSHIGEANQLHAVRIPIKFLAADTVIPLLFLPPPYSGPRVHLMRHRRPFNQELSRAFGNDPRWLWGY
ncbi:hypothetical protein VOLCADRAFT_107148 [Volvox carteri f. nagariensis]|uniref:Sulfotransferase n=1 Tax=Volvox carteri f. nagariensis TaxID=3068 RepID=D8UC72_VOLCA|nr:uncharacterized protein VOLCADRAFT_107148 [Volvox carteri f. nagariensis]EFJ42645.1 hypothetical protein VOLCADRAFT_107148 [Volvox carteri f. nagariensis]|eukprot:XP_002956296.1 hypothetical protein VOLCADRAFT_107148 [Volvox carteri f. nagariensis]